MKILDKNAVVVEAQSTVLNHSTVEELIELSYLRRSLDALNTDEELHPSIKIGLGCIEVKMWTLHAGEFTIVITAEETVIKRGNLELAINKEYRQKVLNIIKKKQANNEFINVELLPL